MNSDCKHTLLMIMHMPPPIHGASMVGELLHSSVYVNDAFNCHYINLTTARSLSDIGKFSFVKLLDFSKLLFRIAKEVHRFKPELVYVTPNSMGGAFFKDFFVITLLKIYGCKIVAHYHNKGVSERQDNIIYNLFYKIFFWHIKVILISKYLYYDVKKYVKEEDVLYCLNGIPDKVNFVGQSKNEVPHILFLSNLLLAKGTIILLDALKILLDKGYEFFCDIVGGETYDFSIESFNKEIVKRNLSDHVICHGPKYGQEKNLMFSKSDIFVFPTLKECFGLVLVEAMSYGLPSVASIEGAIPEIIDDGINGYLIDKNNASQLAEKISILLLDENNRKELGFKARVKYENCFTSTAFEKRFVSVINTCFK